jgi:DegV family protein with EDD domain
MERKFMIITDGNSDLPLQYKKEHNIELMMMGYSVDGVEYLTRTHPEALDEKDFYARMRSGAQTKTMALEPEVITTTMETYLQQGMDVLYIAFSSGLSTTYNNGRLVADDLQEKYPEAKIYVVDSLSASLGQGLLVNYAVTLRDEGKTIDEIVYLLEQNRQKFCHYFTVDDLHFLHRGGRVSKTTAVVGSVLGIKPILHVDEEGHLIAIGKVRGRKQALNALVDKMAEKIGEEKNSVVYISHGDCEEDAKYVADLVKKRFGIKHYLINFIGSSIGSHSGPGTVALFFVGENRTEKK